MSSSSRDRALRLEEALPRVMRTLYRTQDEDPLKDLPIAQVRVMRLLFSGPKSHSAVSDELGISVSAVTQVANRLEALGLVGRLESPLDRRVKHLSLTDCGLKYMKDRQEYRVNRTLTAIKSMPEEKQKQLLLLLDELVEGCQGIPETGAGRPIAAELSDMTTLPAIEDKAII